MRSFLRAKLHRANVTDADLDYEGSITIDRELMRAVDIAPYEKVLVVDATNGARLETYAIEGEAGSGIICINGAAAHLIRKGDVVTIMTFQLAEKPIRPKIAVLDGHNRIAHRGELVPASRQAN